MAGKERVFVLDEDSANVLRKLIYREKRLRQNPESLTVPEPPLPTAPDVYVARTPGAGIPALRRDLDTGTGTLPIGTGSPSGQGHTPGSAICQIFKVIYTSTTPNLVPAGFTRTVLNLGTDSVPGNEWVPIQRDKFGVWITKQPSVEAAAPSFSGCLLKKTDTQNITGGVSLTNITFNTVQVDTDGYTSGSTPWTVITLPFAGYYSINYSLFVTEADNQSNGSFYSMSGSYSDLTSSYLDSKLNISTGGTIYPGEDANEFGDIARINPLMIEPSTVLFLVDRVPLKASGLIYTSLTATTTLTLQFRYSRNSSIRTDVNITSGSFATFLHVHYLGDSP